MLRLQQEVELVGLKTRIWIFHHFLSPKLEEKGGGGYRWSFMGGAEHE